MNKLVIPAILGAVVLIAGMFAFSPVEKASTVHSGLADDIAGVQDDVDNLKAGQVWDRDSAVGDDLCDEADDGNTDNNSAFFDNDTSECVED